MGRKGSDMLIKGLRRIGSSGIIQVICLFFTLTVFIPVLWSSASAFRGSVDFFLNPFGIPSPWKYQNFIYVWTQSNVATYFQNSVFVTAVTVLGIIMISAMASYAISRLRFHGRIALLFWFVGGLFIPAALLLLPLYLVLSDFNLLDSYLGLILVYTAYSLPFTIFVLVPFFNVIPEDLEEAAVIDGASYYRIFWQIALPLAKPGLIVATILNTFGIWNEFVLGYLIITDASLKTLPLGLADILRKHHYTADYGKVFATIVIAIIPIVVVYMIFQRRLSSGLLSGALKE